MTSRLLTAVATLLLSGCVAQIDAISKRAPSPLVVATPPPAPPPVAASPKPAAPQQGPLRPDLSAEEEQRLADGARQNIGDVERMLAEVERAQLKPPQQEAFRTAKNFLDQARAALGQRDYQRAANLASKARALTDDITGTTK